MKTKRSWMIILESQDSQRSSRYNGTNQQCVVFFDNGTQGQGCSKDSKRPNSECLGKQLRWSWTELERTQTNHFCRKQTMCDLFSLLEDRKKKMETINRSLGEILLLENLPQIAGWEKSHYFSRWRILHNGDFNRSIQTCYLYKRIRRQEREKGGKGN